MTYQFEESSERRREQRSQALPHSSLHQQPGLARRLAPEDVAPGQYACVLVRHEVYHRFDCEQERFVGHRVRELPELDSEGDEQAGGRAGQPLRVLWVCLPFVVVRAVGVPRATEDSAPRRVRTLDLRQVELAEVDAAYASVVLIRPRGREDLINTQPRNKGRPARALSWGTRRPACVRSVGVGAGVRRASLQNRRTTMPTSTTLRTAIATGLLAASLTLTACAITASGDTASMSRADKQSLASTANGAEVVAVMMTADWCGPCKQLEPKFQEALTDLPYNSVRVIVADYTDRRDPAATQTLADAGLSGLGESNGGTTGLIYLLDADTGAVLGQITGGGASTAQIRQTMQDAIAQAS
ncbi:Thioredoxin domain-containing protein [Durusdinium trenchii]|uniref:Thioredoxin domain-containing protein n=1 Tax=Durusdinium trenchii TaxID=1381693 RepID=A0ABP0KRW9_9DINO